MIDVQNHPALRATIQKQQRRRAAQDVADALIRMLGITPEARDLVVLLTNRTTATNNRTALASWIASQSADLDQPDLDALCHAVQRHLWARLEYAL